MLHASERDCLISGNLQQLHFQHCVQKLTLTFKACWYFRMSCLSVQMTDLINVQHDPPELAYVLVTDKTLKGALLQKTVGGNRSFVAS